MILAEYVVELKLFDIFRETLIICNSSHAGLGAMLKRPNTDGWQAKNFFLQEFDCDREKL